MFGWASSKPIAVKVINDRQSYKMESAALRTILSHGGHVGICGLADVPRFPFIATDYVSGYTMMQLYNKSEALHLERIVPWFVQLFDTLAWLHHRHIKHGDVKLDNVMIDVFERVKLIDFGLTRVLDSEESRTKKYAVQGTAVYMAPEEWSHELCDVPLAGDVFAAGVCLFGLLTGRFPFETTRNDCVVFERFSQKVAAENDSDIIALEIFSMYGRPQPDVLANSHRLCSLLGSLLHPSWKLRVCALVALVRLSSFFE